MDWIINNKEWIFSGVGIFIITFILKTFIKRKRINIDKQIQKSGDNSINYQSKGDINVNINQTQNDE